MKAHAALLLVLLGCCDTFCAVHAADLSADSAVVAPAHPAVLTIVQKFETVTRIEPLIVLSEHVSAEQIERIRRADRASRAALSALRAQGSHITPDALGRAQHAVAALEAALHTQPQPLPLNPAGVTP